MGLIEKDSAKVNTDVMRVSGNSVGENVVKNDAIGNGLVGSVQRGQRREQQGGEEGEGVLRDHF